MKITDCQVHEIGPYWDWTGESAEAQNRIMSEMMIAYLDAVGVDRVVMFSGDAHGASAWMAANIPDRISFVPHIHCDEPDIEAAVREAKARHNVNQLGVRVLISWPLDGREAKRLDEGGWDPVFAACERHQLPVFTF